MRKFDWISFAIVISLVIIGLMMIYAAGYQPDSVVPFFTTQAGKQSIFVVATILILTLTQLIDWKFWSGVAYPFYAFTILLLVLVLIVGSTINGSTSWFEFGWFNLQPSELAKMGTIMALASFLGHHRTRVSDTRDLMIASGIILLPTALVLAQGDAGSALVFLSIFIVLFREGLAMWIPVLFFILAILFILALKYDVWVVLPLLMFAGSVFLLGGLKRTQAHVLISLGVFLVSLAFAFLGYLNAVIAIAGLYMVYATVESIMAKQTRQVILLSTGIILLFGFAYTSSYLFTNVLESHQQDRINVWLKPEDCDPRGSLYNILQSKIAIGSGGLTGKGYLQGTMTKLNYVPEQSTDFIYSIIGEEHGFIGSIAVIVLFMILLLRMVDIGERARMPFIRHYAYGVVGILFTHFVVNIGMTMGIMPVIGIPLPFISSGGSSLLGFSMLIGVLLSMDSSWMRSRRVM
ncbi:MAG TPA: rod shape-determining protein RodA [Saprospiraceae bacterium]|nr:rod shape-determining protein RodA [Saprospiraceae bacterium]